MKFLLLTSLLLVSVSSCDRSKGKGSDIEWQQRQELRRQEQQRQEEQQNLDKAYRDFEEKKIIKDGARIYEP